MPKITKQFICLGVEQQEDLGILDGEDGNMDNREKTELLNFYFTSVFLLKEKWSVIVRNSVIMGRKEMQMKIGKEVVTEP